VMVILCLMHLDLEYKAALRYPVLLKRQGRRDIHDYRYRFFSCDQNFLTVPMSNLVSL